MGECCNEWKCRRKQPIMLMRSDLTGTWFFVTRWKPLGPEGGFYAIEKHAVGKKQSADLERMREGNLAWQASLGTDVEPELNDGPMRDPS